VRREVYEEAGVVVDQVGYHSSQPWPYPSSLMMGCWGIVKEGSDIRIDLDNELEGTSKSIHPYFRFSLIQFVYSQTLDSSRSNK